MGLAWVWLTFRILVRSSDFYDSALVVINLYFSSDEGAREHGGCIRPQGDMAFYPHKKLAPGLSMM